MGFVRLILLVDWDLIGLLGTPATLDEYDGYAPSVLALLEQGAPDVLIVAYLKQIESERMGIRGNSTERLFAVVRKLQAAYAATYAYEKHPVGEESPD